ncbi:unnamed protein product [Protopolystoma xenopodis]|uniref:Uncharacterized protein n=1 Tax=Protopolystoma xenopodis TaxID=117903 RepID=A0A3S5A0D0_9PLAT|nr:unnamed protein product [Protopolystoma xenopodis]
MMLQFRPSQPFRQGAKKHRSTNTSSSPPPPLLASSPLPQSPPPTFEPIMRCLKTGCMPSSPRFDCLGFEARSPLSQSSNPNQHSTNSEPGHLLPVRSISNRYRNPILFQPSTWRRTASNSSPPRETFGSFNNTSCSPDSVSDPTFSSSFNSNLSTSPGATTGLASGKTVLPEGLARFAANSCLNRRRINPLTISSTAITFEDSLQWPNPNPLHHPSPVENPPQNFATKASSSPPLVASAVTSVVPAGSLPSSPMRSTHSPRLVGRSHISPLAQAFWLANGLRGSDCIPEEDEESIGTSKTVATASNALVATTTPKVQSLTAKHVISRNMVSGGQRNPTNSSWAAEMASLRFGTGIWNTTSVSTSPSISNWSKRLVGHPTPSPPPPPSLSSPAVTSFLDVRMAALKAAVPRRPVGCGARMKQYFSAPPGIYWPETIIEQVEEEEQEEVEGQEEEQNEEHKRGKSEEIERQVSMSHSPHQPSDDTLQLGRLEPSITGDTRQLKDAAAVINGCESAVAMEVSFATSLSDNLSSISSPSSSDMADSGTDGPGHKDWFGSGNTAAWFVPLGPAFPEGFATTTTTTSAPMAMCTEVSSAWPQAWDSSVSTFANQSFAMTGLPTRPVSAGPEGAVLCEQIYDDLAGDEVEQNLVIYSNCRLPRQITSE